MARDGGPTLGQTPWIATPNASFGLALVDQRAKKWVGGTKLQKTVSPGSRCSFSTSQSQHQRHRMLRRLLKVIVLVELLGAVVKRMHQ